MADEIAEAARRLAAGEPVAFPTETVYGLGADATNVAAVGRIFALKGRPADHPLIVHVASIAGLERWAVDVPPAARMLASQFWPGPLTMIVRKSGSLPAAVTGGQDTVGLRCPSHPIAQRMLRAFEGIGSGAVAAPSANRFGHVSPTTAEHVREEFGPDLLVLDGGECEVGLESTIVDVSREAAVLLRPGAVSRDQIAAVLGMAPRDRDAEAPRASGTLEAHYAPRTALWVVPPDVIDTEARSADVAVLALHEPPAWSKARLWITAQPNAVRYAHDFYASLRRLDASGARRLFIERTPDAPAWEAINDRLRRAAAGTGFTDDEP